MCQREQLQFVIGGKALPVSVTAEGIFYAYLRGILHEHKTFAGLRRLIVAELKKPMVVDAAAIGYPDPDWTKATFTVKKVTFGEVNEPPEPKSPIPPDRA